LSGGVEWREKREERKDVECEVRSGCGCVGRAGVCVVAGDWQQQVESDWVWGG
jgi:hypothetical protein